MARILVIDDDVGVRASIKLILTEQHHTVFLAEDGWQGLKIFRRERPDLVVTDIIMPIQEGLETIIAMRRDNPQARIIAMSGGDGGRCDFLDAALEFGATETITKPFGAVPFMLCVDRCLTVDRCVGGCSDHARSPPAPGLD